MNQNSYIAKLYTSAKLGPYLLKNRIVMGPMTRSRATADNTPTDIMRIYYQQRTQAGLIISEGISTSPSAIGYANTPGLFNQAQAHAWTRITTAVHEQGSRIFAQLWHVGRVSLPYYLHGKNPLAPSAIKPDGEHYTPEGAKPFVTPKAMSISEIKQTILEFKHAAKHANQAGFDGVELHGAYSYLLEQFLRDGSNQRQDRYGKTLADRCRFVLEVIEAVATEIDISRIGLRISPINSAYRSFRSIDSQIEDTYSYLVEQLNQYDLAYLHVVENIAGPRMDTETNFNVSKLRKIYRGTYLVNGGYDRDKAINTVAIGAADFVVFSSAFIANPDLPNRFKYNYPIHQSDPSKHYVGGPEGYIDYPIFAEEQSYQRA